MKLIKENLNGNKAERWDYALGQINECLKNFGDIYFIDCGTLLGLVRQDDYIQWDNDIDIGLICVGHGIERHKNLAIKLADLGFHVNFSASGITCIKAPDVEINITFYRFHNKMYEAYLYTNSKNYFSFSFFKNVIDKKYHLVLGHSSKFILKRIIIKNSWILRVIPKLLFKFFLQTKEHKVNVPAHFFRIGLHSFHGMTVPVPFDSVGYLEYRYGLNWRSPRKEYSYGVDDRTIVKDSE